jgi:hypothetical protein
MKQNFTQKIKTLGAFFALMFIGSTFFAQNLVITTEVCAGATSVRMTGPFWNWDPNAGPVAVDNGNGTFTFTFSPAPTATMEYLLIKDGVQENLISAMVAGGSCAPVTDYFSYANRQWLTTDPLTISNVYGQCGNCSGLYITIDVCSTSADTVRMTGPFWGWDPNGGPIAVNNGNGTWTVNLDPAPTADMEYLFVVDGVQENLIADMQNGGDCAPITDYTNYANRKWLVGDGNVTDIYFDRCVPCTYPDLVITTEVCDSANSVNLTGPIWGWNPAFGPQAVDNGNGTWTFTLSPVPSDSLEYLLVINGQVVENLIQSMVDGGTCAPVTDYFSYANRRWTIADATAISNTYGSCLDCVTQSIDENTLNPVAVYPNPAKSVISIKRELNMDKIQVYSTVGNKILDVDVNTNEYELNIENLASGVYQVVVLGANAISRTQIIKE